MRGIGSGSELESDWAGKETEGGTRGWGRSWKRDLIWERGYRADSEDGAGLRAGT